MWQDFKAFISRGNALDLALGVVIGTAFGKIVSSLVSDIIMPPFGLILSDLDFSKLSITLRAASLSHEAIYLRIGLFLTSIIDFIIIGAAIFLLQKQLSKFEKDQLISTKICPRCCNSIALSASRCGFCTSELN